MLQELKEVNTSALYLKKGHLIGLCVYEPFLFSDKEKFANMADHKQTHVHLGHPREQTHYLSYGGQGVDSQHHPRSNTSVGLTSTHLKPSSLVIEGFN